MDDVLERGAGWKGNPDTKMPQSELLDYSTQQGLSVSHSWTHVSLHVRLQELWGIWSLGTWHQFHSPFSIVAFKPFFFFTQPLVRKYFTLQSIHMCVRHKTEVTLGWCPLKMSFCSILFFSVLWWFTDGESWPLRWKLLLYTSAGKPETLFPPPLQLMLRVFSALQTQCPPVPFAISAAKHAVEVFGLSRQCQQK